MSLNKKFPHAINDVIIVKCENNYYYGKIKSIDKRRRKCKVLFDDKSTDDLSFNDIHSVGDTTTEIVCIVCKDGRSESPNEIVLCDQCGIGYHQQCHSPRIPASVLKPDAPWLCHYCLSKEICPYFVKNPFSDNKGKSVKNQKKATDAKLSKNSGPDSASTVSQNVANNKKKSSSKNSKISPHKNTSKRKLEDVDESEQATSGEDDEDEDDDDIDYQDTIRKRRRAAIVARKRVQKYMKETGVASDSDTDGTNAAKKTGDADFNINAAIHNAGGTALLTDSRAVSNFPMASSSGFGTSPGLNLNNNYSMSGMRIQSPVMMPQMNNIINDHTMHNSPNQIFNMANGLVKSPPVHSPTLGALQSPMANDMQTSPTFVSESFQLSNNLNQAPYYQPQSQTINNIDYASQPLSGYNSPVQNFTNPSHIPLSPQMTSQYGNHSHVYSQHHSHHVPSMIHGQDPHYQHFANFHNMPSQDVTSYSVPQYNQYHWLSHQQQPQAMQHLPSAQYTMSPMQPVGGGLGIPGTSNQQYSMGQQEQSTSQKLSHGNDQQLSMNNISNANFSTSNSFPISNEAKDNIDKLDSKEILSMPPEASILDVANKTPTMRRHSKKSDSECGIEKEITSKPTIGEQFETVEDIKSQIKTNSISHNKHNENHNPMGFRKSQESNKDLSQLNAEILQKKAIETACNSAKGNGSSVYKTSPDSSTTKLKQVDKTITKTDKGQVNPISSKVKKDFKDEAITSSDSIVKIKESRNKSTNDTVESGNATDGCHERNKMDKAANSTEKSSSNDCNQQFCDARKDCKDDLKHVKEKRNLEERVDNNSSHDRSDDACKGNLNLSVL